MASAFGPSAGLSRPAHRRGQKLPDPLVLGLAEGEGFVYGHPAAGGHASLAGLWIDAWLGVGLPAQTRAAALSEREIVEVAALLEEAFVLDGHPRSHQGLGGCRDALSGLA